ncbi:hypothetical protein PG994_008010 [Apiospora phragmitis]|uniref:TauD/TfdA-like domain-containing protein n=1 Tax=Apiospora phragmitis TaxID=2905665 RepID=A0ABR1URU6_9PEZI
MAAMKSSMHILARSTRPFARPVVRSRHSLSLSRPLSSSPAQGKPAMTMDCAAEGPGSSGDAEFLRKMVLSFPNILHQDKANLSEQQQQPADQYFEFPLGARFSAPTREVGLSMRDMVSCSLLEHGVAAIELGFEDEKSDFLVELVKQMNFEADSHSSTQGPLWDITPKPEGIESTSPGATAAGRAHSRSHGVGEFAWHTDGSYEARPQRFFGFHIVRPDRLGGGVFRVLPAQTLMASLSPAAVAALLRTEFDIRVPDEFYKGVATNRGKLLDLDPATGHYLLRFRAEILPDPPKPGDEAANAAVAELKRLLDDPETKGLRLPDDVFKENVVLLMDNSRFLHMRTTINDKRRLLRRIRFHPKKA